MTSVRPADNSFIARERELAALVAAFASACSGSGKLVLLTGEGGIGKTRLIEHFAASLPSNAAVVLWGRCHPDPDVPAYWPWRRIVEAYAERRDDAELLQVLGQGAPGHRAARSGTERSIPSARTPGDARASRGEAPAFR